MNNYQELAMRTNDGKCTERLLTSMNIFEEQNIDFGGVLNASLGLSGEVGEFNDMIKKTIFHQSPFDEDHAKKELGDILWYVAMMCKSFNWNMNDIMEINIAKLKSRYPQGFDVIKANNRSKDDL